MILINEIVKFNQKQLILFKKYQNIQEYLSENIDISVHDILYDLIYIRELLKDLLKQKNFTNFRHHLFYSQQSIQQFAILIDRILFFIYRISMPLSMIILFKSNNQSNISSSTINQLLDIRKTAIDPPSVYRGCPT
ncbi:unnamed protein product [Rotaria sordida]|uniref:Uncharacterized protein n=1 Tax=Rotaria sordida TaxID=392033 RepID=A0A815AKM8_9BILA|nr:unnamed protein product [Rotaria sordida]